VFAKFGLITFPLAFAFSPSITYLYFANFAVGVFSALSDTAILAYLFDVTPSGQRGVHISLYNLAVGTSYFLGSVTGGMLVALGLPIFALAVSLQFVYIISALGRGASALLHHRLIEIRQSQTTLKEALLEELHINSPKRIRQPDSTH
jgi:MFS family permease